MNIAALVACCFIYLSSVEVLSSIMGINLTLLLLVFVIIAAILFEISHALYNFFNSIKK